METEWKEPPVTGKQYKQAIEQVELWTNIIKQYEKENNISSQLEPPVSLRATSAIKLLDTISAYHEYSMREHCYKFSIKNIPCLIVTAETQEEAALKMVAEIQKHLSESN